MSKHKKSTVKYIDNDEFYDKIKDYIYECRECEREGREKPVVPRYIAECFVKIAEGLSITSKWRNYSELEDFKSEAVMTCIKYVDKFDPDKFDNPFSYFTTTCVNAMQYSKKKFLKSLYVKYKYEGVLKHESDLLRETDETMNDEVRNSEEAQINKDDFITSFEKNYIEYPKQKKLEREQRQRLEEEQEREDENVNN